MGDIAILYVFLLFGYDSIPPLPDLSKIEFLEPALWIEPAERMIRINGFAGQVYGVDFGLDFRSFLARGQFNRNNEWDSTDIGSALISYAITLPRIWVKPGVRAQLLRRHGDYKQIAPGLEFTLFTSPLVATGMLEYSHWLINDNNSREATGEVSLIFDQVTFTPSMTISGIYTGKRLKPSLFAQLNIHKFHLNMGSLIKTGFPSPYVSVRYSEPWIEVVTDVQAGVKHNTLAQYFKPEVPINYTIDIPTETLKVALALSMEFNIHEQSFTMGGSYREWLYRLNIGENYDITPTREIEEIKLEICAKNILRLNNVGLSNAIHMQYITSDSTITFLPDIVVYDTLELGIGFFELSTDFRYVSQRDGIEKTLPRYYIINTTVGLRLSFVKIYFTAHNITDENSEIYDDYYFMGRQYSGGVEIRQRF